MSFYKVYVSSTYRDLKSYRETVRDSLQKVPNFKVVGMEDYTAEGIKPLDRCLRDVEECHIYILILANRYGYVIEGQDLSITHQEYNKAKELNKVILVFKAESSTGQFPADADDPNQPASAWKQAKLKELKDEVGRLSLSHPEGFTSEYHLALQVMESLVRNKDVDFDGELPEERKIFCDRKLQVNQFYALNRENRPFNVFLIQGEEMDLGESLVDRLSKYYLSIPEPTSLNYSDFIADDSYANFRIRFFDELCLRLFSYNNTVPNDPAGVLNALKNNGVKTLTLLSSVRDDLQTKQGYTFLDNIIKEFSETAVAVAEVRVFWFIVIDKATALKEQISSTGISPPLPLTPLYKDDIKSWIRDYIDNDIGNAIAIQKLCFPETSDSSSRFDMYQVQWQIKKFIKRFNLRRKNNDQELLDILP